MDVGTERDVPFLGADILDLLEAALVRGVVNQNVQPAQLAYRALDQVLAMGLVLYVTGSEHGAPARLLHPARRLTRVLVLVRGRIAREFRERPWDRMELIATAEGLAAA